MLIISTDRILARAIEVILNDQGIKDTEIRNTLPELFDFAIVDLDTANGDISKKNVLTVSADKKKGADILRPFSENDFILAVMQTLNKTGDDLQKKNSSLLVLEEKGFSYKGKTISLSPHEKRIFSLLYRKAGQCVTAKEIRDAIGSSTPESSAVTVYISFLRKKLDFEFGERLIYNIRGKGYTLRLPKD